jgi:hypothetical protein
VGAWRAPITVSRGSPPSKSVTVGIESTSYAPDLGCSSMLSFTNVTRAGGFGELVEERLDRVARLAPRRPEVDDDGRRRSRRRSRRIELLH